MPTSMFDEIGGEPAIAALVDDLYRRALGDPVLAPYFEGCDVQAVKAHQRALVGVALGRAPSEYGGRTMHHAHARLAVTGDAFDRVLAHLAAALAAAGVAPATASRLMAILRPLRTDVVQPIPVT